MFGLKSCQICFLKDSIVKVLVKVLVNLKYLDVPLIVTAFLIDYPGFVNQYLLYRVLKYRKKQRHMSFSAVVYGLKQCVRAVSPGTLSTEAKTDLFAVGSLGARLDCS